MHKVNVPKEDRFFPKISVAIAIMLLLILIGTIIISSTTNSTKEAFYLSTKMITTAELEGAEGNSRYAVLTLSILGSVTIFYIVYVILEYVLEGKFKNIFSEVRILNQIKHLKGHYIICGGGRVGKHVAKELQRYNKEFVILEQNQEEAEELKKNNFPVLNCNSLDEINLVNAGIHHATNLISCLGNDGDNILQVLTAKELNPNLKIGARASEEKIVSKLRHAGASHVITPEVLGGVQLAREMMRYDLLK